MNESTRSGVLAAIHDLHFVPRAEATARARKVMGRIGVLAPFFTYASFVQRLRGVAEALAAAHHELVIYNVATAAQRDAYLTNVALTRRLDGLILMSLPCDPSVIDRLIAAQLEVVLIEHPHPHCSSVLIDDAHGGALVADYFVAQGHRRCAFVGDTAMPDYSLPTSDARLQGFRQALAAASISLSDEYIALGPHGMAQAYCQAQRLWALAEPPTAIFAASDTQALGVLKAVRERGMRVPEDVAVVGFDDIECAAYVGLTTVRQPLEDSGRVAVELLLARLADPERSTQRVPVHRPGAPAPRSTHK